MRKMVEPMPLNYEKLIFKVFSSYYTEFVLVLMGLVICKRRSICVFIIEIYHRCRYTVAYHPKVILARHVNRSRSTINVNILPVFSMVFITVMVVDPRLTVAFLFTLRSIGTANALIVPGANAKLRGTVLGQVMYQSLPV